MQTCSVCNYQSPDSELNCINCGADLSELSKHAVQLKELIANPRVIAIRISVAKTACITCREIEGVYSKETVPSLPIEGCSNSYGCVCSYAPILDEVFP